MNKEKDEEKFVIDGNPGTGNMFVKIGHVDHYNPNANSATTNITNYYYYGKEEEEVGVDSVSSKPGDKKLGNMTFREMLKAGYVNTGNIQLLIMKYVSCIRPYVKDEKDKLFMHLWKLILEHDAFKIELYDPGKQDCKFNRNLVGNIMHYLDDKDFYKAPYNQSEMTRAVEGDADNPVRKGFREYPDKKFCDVVDSIIKDYQDK